MFLICNSCNTHVLSTDTDKDTHTHHNHNTLTPTHEHGLLEQQRIIQKTVMRICNIHYNCSDLCNE